MAKVTTALLAALMVLAACGGDDGDDGDAAADSGTTTETTSGGETGSDDGDAVSTETTTDTGGETGGETSEEAATFCDEVIRLGESLVPDPAQPPTAEQGQELVESLREVEAPAEIAEDWNIMLDAMEEGLASGTEPSQEADPELNEAVTNLGVYSQQNCAG